jgi:glycerol uptake facilitator-like aquaporin
MLEFFFGMLLLIGVPSAGVSAYLATLPCRFLTSRRRRPGWHIAILIALLCGALAVLVLGGADVIHPAKWDSGKLSFKEVAPLWFAAASIGALVSAWYVVAHYRDKIEQPNDF